MSRYATYPSTTTPPMARKWVIRALFLSLLIHAGFLTFAYLKRLDNFGFNNAAPAPTPARFVMQQATIDSSLLESPDEAATKLEDQKPAPRPDITIPSEKPEAQDIQLSPQVKELQSPVLDESPKAKPINWEDVKRTEAISAGNDDRKLGSLTATWLNESVPAPNQPTIKFPAGTKFGDATDGGMEGIPGRQSVDDALARTGPLPAGDKPIAMPGGALFDYDKAELRPEALANLQKLGELIRRNPDATFRIEGHTDAIGARDYNLGLSQARADSVKAWLVRILGIDPNRIETVGFGPDQLIAPANGSIEEQQPNRRVEIVIKTNRAR